jgi:hypothetical protein
VSGQGELDEAIVERDRSDRSRRGEGEFAGRRQQAEPVPVGLVAPPDALAPAEHGPPVLLVPPEAPDLVAADAVELELRQGFLQIFGSLGILVAT